MNFRITLGEIDTAATTGLIVITSGLIILLIVGVATLTFPVAF